MLSTGHVGARYFMGTSHAENVTKSVVAGAVLLEIGSCIFSGTADLGAKDEDAMLEGIDPGAHCPAGNTLVRRIELWAGS